MKLSWLLLVCPCAANAAASREINSELVCNKKCRTRFTFCRPTGENVSSILFGGSSRSPKRQQNDGISFNHDEVGITKPISSGSDIFPSCIGYTKTMRKQVKLQKQKIVVDVESKDDDATTICSNNTIDGWRVLRFSKRVGHGKNCYKRVQNAMFNWDFEEHVKNKSMGIMSAKAQKEGYLDIGFKNKDNMVDCTAPRRSLLATFTEICLPKPLKSFFVVNPVHVVYEVKDDTHHVQKSVYSSSSYATVSGHLLAGEERVTVVWRKGMGGEVDVEIVSFSRSAPSLVGKIIWPLIGRMQTQFFLSELDHLDNVAKDKTSIKGQNNNIHDSYTRVEQDSRGQAKT